MRVVAFNGSPRFNGNSHHLLEHVFAPLKKAGIECEEIRIGGTLLHGCKACGGCAKKPGACVQTDDPMNEWVAKMKSADGIILASPTYFANVTTEMKALIDRAGVVCLNDNHCLRHKVGAPVVVARRGGAVQVYNVMMSFFGINSMVVPMSSYWNDGVGLAPGDVEKDDEALHTMQELGANMAWVLQNLHGK